MAELDLNRPAGSPDAVAASWRADRDNIAHSFSAAEIARLIDVRFVEEWPLTWTRRARAALRSGHVETILQGTSWEASNGQALR